MLQFFQVWNNCFHSSSFTCCNVSLRLNARATHSAAPEQHFLLVEFCEFFRRHRVDGAAGLLESLLTLLALRRLIQKFVQTDNTTACGVFAGT